MSLKAKKSFIWNFFNISNEPGIAVCNICKKKTSYKSSISNLKKHMERIHPTIRVKETERHQDEDNPSPVLSLPPTIETVEERTATPPSQEMELCHPTAGHPTAGHSGSKQAKMSSYVRRKITGTEKKKITDSFLKLFYRDLQPFSITEDPGFREFVFQLNPNFQIPTRQTVSKSLIPAKYESCFRSVSEALQRVKSICLTTDAWTSTNNESYIGVTGHYIDEDFNFKKVLLKCSATTARHTSENLAADLKEVISSWNLENKVALVVTDNAANIVGAVKDKLQLKHLGCFGHTINLIVKDALSQLEVHTLITRVRTIVAHFKRSTVSMNKLIESQHKLNVEPKKILQDVATRWNSTYYMIERFLELEEPIRSVMGLLDLTAIELLTSQEWLILKDLLYVLSPFEKATKCTSGEKHMTAAMVIPVTNGLSELCSEYLKQKGKTLREPALSVLRELEQGVMSRLGNVEHSKTLSISTFLDPRFKMQAFKSTVAADSAKETVVRAVAAEIQEQLKKAAEAQNELKRCQHEPAEGSAKAGEDKNSLTLFTFLKNKVALEANSKKSSSRAKAIMEVDRFLEDGYLDVKKDPSQWWQENWRNYPNISKLLQTKCCGVATSVPCERLFSKASNIIGERRTRLKNTKVSQLIFLSENAHFLSSA